MKPFKKLLSLIRGKTDEEICAEVEAYPHCGECKDCDPEPVVNCYCCLKEHKESELIDGHRCPKCKCSIVHDREMGK